MRRIGENQLISVIPNKPHESPSNAFKRGFDPDGPSGEVAYFSDIISSYGMNVLISALLITTMPFTVIDDVDFDGLLYVQMYDIIRRVVLVSPTCLFFKLVDQPLVCLKPLKTDEDVGLFVKALYENDSIIDLYCEHNGYDIMEMIQDQIAPKDQSVKPPFKCNADDYAHSTHENLEDLKDIVDFEVEGSVHVNWRLKTEMMARFTLKGCIFALRVLSKGWKQSDVPNCMGCGRGRKQRQLGLVPVSCFRRFSAWDIGEGSMLFSDGQKGLLEVVENTCIAFFEIDRCSAAFENGISKSFNSRIVPARETGISEGKKQRSWLVYPSAFRKVEVRRGDYGYGVNLHIKKCGCNFWELSGIPCVHAMAAYYHMNMDPELGEYQHKMDMEALAEAENEANDLYWENMAKEFRDDELNRPEDSLEAAYSFDIISEFQDNELNMHQVSMDLPVNEAPENYNHEEINSRIYIQNLTIQYTRKVKKFKFDANRTGSTADKAFNVSKD
ncbi:zinc finger, PMZ-type containing protein [Tanacetum coccineum]